MASGVALARPLAACVWGRRVRVLGQLCLGGELVIEDRAGGVQQFEELWFGDGVPDAGAFAAGGHQAAAAHEGEVLRDVGGFHADTLLNLTHGQASSIAKNFEDADPHGVRERAEEFGLEVLKRRNHGPMVALSRITWYIRRYASIHVWSDLSSLSPKQTIAAKLGATVRGAA